LRVKKKNPLTPLFCHSSFYSLKKIMAGYKIPTNHRHVTIKRKVGAASHDIKMILRSSDLDKKRLETAEKRNAVAIRKAMKTKTKGNVPFSTNRTAKKKKPWEKQMRSNVRVEPLDDFYLRGLGERFPGSEISDEYEDIKDINEIVGHLSSLRDQSQVHEQSISEKYALEHFAPPNTDVEKMPRRERDQLQLKVDTLKAKEVQKYNKSLYENENEGDLYELVYSPRSSIPKAIFDSQQKAIEKQKTLERVEKAKQALEKKNRMTTLKSKLKAFSNTTGSVFHKTINLHHETKEKTEKIRLENDIVHQMTEKYKDNDVFKETMEKRVGSPEAKKAKKHVEEFSEMIALATPKKNQDPAPKIPSLNTTAMKQQQRTQSPLVSHRSPTTPQHQSARSPRSSARSSRTSTRSTVSKKRPSQPSSPQSPKNSARSSTHTPRSPPTKMVLRGFDPMDSPRSQANVKTKIEQVNEKHQYQPPTLNKTRSGPVPSGKRKARGIVTGPRRRRRGSRASIANSESSSAASTPNSSARGDNNLNLLSMVVNDEDTKKKNPTRKKSIIKK